MAGSTRSGSRAATPACAGVQRGFTYLGLMFAIAVLGITLATVGVLWSTQRQREREALLLWVGDQYRKAISHYRLVGGQFPVELADLIEDKRFAQAHHHLRRLYPDPMTGAVDWQLIPAPGGGFMGIASSSRAKPIKIANFPDVDAAFEASACYCDWKFVFTTRNGRLVRAAPNGTVN